MVWEWFEEHDQEIKALLCLQILQISVCEMCWNNKSNRRRLYIDSYKTEDTTEWQIPQGIFRDLVESMPLVELEDLQYVGTRGPTGR